MEHFECLSIYKKCSRRAYRASTNPEFPLRPIDKGQDCGRSGDTGATEQSGTVGIDVAVLVVWPTRERTGHAVLRMHPLDTLFHPGIRISDAYAAKPERAMLIAASREMACTAGRRLVLKDSTQGLVATAAAGMPVADVSRIGCEWVPRGRTR